MSLKRTLLGNTSIEVTELCMGTLILGTLQADLSPEEGALAVRHALESGINFIDTAKGYKTYAHVAEALKGYKGEAVIASKSPVKDGAQMREDVESCLKELNRDCIDIFHLHLVKDNEDMLSREGALDTLVKCRQEGLIRAIGLSAHGPEGTLCSLQYSDIDVVLPILNRKGLGIINGSQEEMTAAIQKIRSKGLGLYDMKPLGGGHLIDDIPASISYIRETGLFDSISVGLKTPEEVDVMIGVFEGGDANIERALEIGKSRAGQKHLIVYEFACERCGNCVTACAQGAMSLGEKIAEVDHEKCILCGYCAADCPKFAIRVV